MKNFFLLKIHDRFLSANNVAVSIIAINHF